MNAERGVIGAVLRIPQEFESRGDVSFQRLLLETGYYHEYASVDLPLIEDALRKEHGIVKLWMQYSQDKRCSSGWFIQRTESGTWEVGYMERGTFRQMTDFKDEIAACAAFIKNEIESMRVSLD